MHCGEKPHSLTSLFPKEIYDVLEKTCHPWTNRIRISDKRQNVDKYLLLCNLPATRSRQTCRCSFWTTMSLHSNDCELANLRRVTLLPTYYRCGNGYVCRSGMCSSEISARNNDGITAHQPVLVQPGTNIWVCRIPWTHSRPAFENLWRFYIMLCYCILMWQLRGLWTSIIPTDNTFLVRYLFA